MFKPDFRGDHAWGHHCPMQGILNIAPSVIPGTLKIQPSPFTLPSGFNGHYAPATYNTHQGYYNGYNNYMDNFAFQHDPRGGRRRSNLVNRPMDSGIKMDHDGFEVALNMSHFTAEEISVRVVDGYMVVEAKHPERTDPYGLVSRHMCRRFVLPEIYNAEAACSTLCADGTLRVRAPKRTDTVRGERNVPILSVPVYTHNHYTPESVQ